jgi:large subunit ribosomal protein L24
MKKLKIRKGDMVFVITGNDKDLAKPKRVLDIYPDKMKVLVEGVNVRIRHTKPSQQNQKGGRLSKEMPIHYSNVMLADSDRNPTRIGIRREDKGKKAVSVRYAKSNGKDL